MYWTHDEHTANHHFYGIEVGHKGGLGNTIIQAVVGKKQALGWSDKEQRRIKSCQAKWCLAIWLAS